MYVYIYITCSCIYKSGVEGNGLGQNYTCRSISLFTSCKIMVLDEITQKAYEEKIRGKMIA